LEKAVLGKDKRNLVLIGAVVDSKMRKIATRVALVKVERHNDEEGEVFLVFKKVDEYDISHEKFSKKIKLVIF